MKVMYQDIDDSSNTTAKLDPSIDEVHFPALILENIRADLRNSTLMLPASARKLQEDWHVGVLNRF
jgi:hypothetical protein